MDALAWGKLQPRYSIEIVFDANHRNFAGRTITVRIPRSRSPEAEEAQHIRSFYPNPVYEKAFENPERAKNLTSIP